MSRRKNNRIRRVLGGVLEGQMACTEVHIQFVLPIPYNRQRFIASPFDEQYSQNIAWEGFHAMCEILTVRDA
ncbi:MAG TPA: hypothetical protein DDW52_16500 [Planctomycetaceae bacterium]|nr:hypothetical protein [Planctomycetaceae bacterium]